MITPRAGHAAALLPDGKVLVVGGSGDGTSAELYDPITATWSPTGRALSPTASLMLLPNGKVLGTGELYDPATRTWSTSSIPHGLLLPDGDLLIDGDPTLVYDLQTGRSRATGAHVVPRHEGHQLTLLLNGKVLLSGGAVPGYGGARGEGAAPGELYEPSTGTWTTTAGLLQPRTGHSAVLLADGKVLISGGQTLSFAGSNGPSSVESAEEYDPATGKWSAAGDAGNQGSLTLLPGGQVLAAGRHPFQILHDVGELCDYAPTASLFDPVAHSWTATGGAGLIDTSGRPGHTATLLNNGTVLVAGGAHIVVGTPAGGGPPCGLSSTPLASAELYTPPQANVLPASCTLTLAGTAPNGLAFIRVATRDIASGLQSVQVRQSTNATVAVPKFAPASRDPAVVTATKIVANQPSTLSLSVTNRAGKTLNCDPVIAQLVDQRDGGGRQVFSDLPRAESKLQITNGTPGLRRLAVRVNGHRFHLGNLRDGEVGRLDVASAMRPGDHNTIAVTTHGPPDSGALLVISD